MWTYWSKPALTKSEWVENEEEKNAIQKKKNEEMHLGFILINSSTCRNLMFRFRSFSLQRLAHLTRVVFLILKPRWISTKQAKDAFHTWFSSLSKEPLSAVFFYSSSSFKFLIRKNRWGKNKLKMLTRKNPLNRRKKKILARHFYVFVFM